MDENIVAVNKSAAFHVYADLCEVRNYSNVEANYVDLNYAEQNVHYIYFKAIRHANGNKIEYVLPVDQFENSNETIDLVKIRNIQNAIQNKQVDNMESKKIKLGIVSSDCTTVYYELTFELDYNEDMDLNY